MSRSQAAVVKAAVVSLLTDRLTLEGVQVAYAHPGGRVASKRIVYCGRVTSTSTIATMRAGRKTRDEELRVEVHIEVVGDGLDQETVDDDALSIGGELEDALADDPRLGTTGELQWLTVAETELLPFQTDQGRAAALTITLTIRARLT